MIWFKDLWFSNFNNKILLFQSFDNHFYVSVNWLVKEKLLVLTENNKHTKKNLNICPQSCKI